MRQITLNRQLLGLEDLLFGTGTVTQNRANQVVTITEINAGNLPFDETRTLVEFAQDTNLEELGNSVEAINNLNNNLDKLLIVEDNLPIINNVGAIKESIVTLDTNILALQNIDTNMSSINTVEDNLPIINNVEAIKESIVTLDTNILALQNIDTNMSSINTVEDNLPIINNVGAIKESIVTLDTNILALQNIDTNMSSINTVEDNLPDVVSVAQNIVPNLTEILNVDTLAAQVTQDKSDVSSMKLAVETIYDTFDDRFLGAKIVDPTLDNDGNALIDGAMYFNTSSNTMKVYDVGTTTWYSIPQIYLSALLDVQLTSITSGNVLRWNGTKWINYTLSKSDVGLNLVDNTADSAKNVLSSTKLTTARTINGVSFDGSANITAPTDLGITAGTTNGPIVTSSSGTNATLPSASATASGVVTTGAQTIAGVKTFSSSPISTATQGTAVNALTRKDYVDELNTITSLTDKATPVDTDVIKIQESGGLFKKLTWANLKASLFNGTFSLTVNGYIKFPTVMGGLIIQWGSASTTPSGVPVNFPIAFPYTVFNVQVSSFSSSAVMVTFQGVTRTGAYLQAWDANGTQLGSQGIHYFVIGN